MTVAPIRVLVADDSPTVCGVLVTHLKCAPEFEVSAVVHSGEAAVDRVAALRPQVVILDIEMPGMGGLAALDRIMSTCPTPVVLLTGVSGGAIQQTVVGLARGAVDFLLKYSPGRDVSPEEFRRDLVARVRTAARIKVIRSLSRSNRIQGDEIPTLARVGGVAPEVVIVGASTGGPAALRELLSGLPNKYDARILVVQHMPARFTRDLAAMLTRLTPWDVREAEDGARLEPRRALVAPGDRHAVLTSDGRVRLSDGAKVNGYRPSIDLAMESAAREFRPRVAGVLLTGMGEDGVRGLAAIRAAGGRTFAQDEQSSVVYGMPQRAADLGAADEIDNPTGIAARLICGRH